MTIYVAIYTVVWLDFCSAHEEGNLVTSLVSILFRSIAQQHFPLTNSNVLPYAVVQCLLFTVHVEAN